MSDAIERLLVMSRSFADQRGLQDYKIDFKYVTGYRRTIVFHVSISDNSNAISYFAKVGVNLSEDVRAFVEKEATMTMTVHKRFPHSTAFATVEPVGYFPDHAVFATLSIPGKRLDHELLAALRWPTRDRIRRAEALLKNCADWLVAFQNSWPQDGQLDGESLLVGIRRQLDRLSKANPALFSPSLLTHIISVAEPLANMFNENAYHPVMRHDDFAPWNVIAQGDKIVVFDFPNVQRGSKNYDRYYFDHALSTFSNKPFVNKRQLSHLRRHFASCLDEPSENPLAEQRFFAIYFSLVRLGSLIFLGRPKFPRNILTQIRVRIEMKRLQGLCKD